MNLHTNRELLDHPNFHHHHNESRYPFLDATILELFHKIKTLFVLTGVCSTTGFGHLHPLHQM